MQLFIQNQQHLNELKEIPFKLEKDIQTLFEQNLEKVTGFSFVVTEFEVKSRRIDTLAFDEENKAFVIIEYKRNKNHSVMDQGISYLNLMLENKAEFIVEYNEKLGKTLKRNDVDWSQSTVIFVAPSFTEFQVESSNFKDLPIELWEIKQYENHLVAITPIKKSKSAPSIKQIQTAEDSQINRITQEVRAYDETYHLAGKQEETVELYETYKNAILNLADNIELQFKKLIIGFKKNKKILADIRVQSNGLKIWINLKRGQLDDPKNLMRDVSSTGHWGNGDYEITVQNTKYLEYLMSLIKQTL